MDLTYFDQQFEVLYPEFDVVGFDLSGHGLTHGIPADCEFGTAVEVLKTVIDQTGAASVSPCGCIGWQPDFTGIYAGLSGDGAFRDADRICRHAV
jgi:pimeloyl-ACP methyl ester carboxylesterase